MNLSIIRCWFDDHKLKIKKRNINNSDYYPRHLVICKRCEKEFIYSELFDDLKTKSYYNELHKRREEKEQLRKEIEGL